VWSPLLKSLLKKTVYQGRRGAQGPGGRLPRPQLTLSKSGGADYAPLHLPPDFQTFLQPWCRRRKGGRSTWVIIEMFIKCQCTVGVRGKNLSATGYSCNVLLAQKCQNQCTLYASGFYNWQIYEVSWICKLIYFCL
jgi:hypothetical protein